MLAMGQGRVEVSHEQERAAALEEDLGPLAASGSTKSVRRIARLGAGQPNKSKTCYL